MATISPVDAITLLKKYAIDNELTERLMLIATITIEMSLCQRTRTQYVECGLQDVILDILIETANYPRDKRSQVGQKASAHSEPGIIY